MAINRYDNIPTKIGDNNKRVVRSVIYPPIPRDVNDVYVITTIGDRLDLLSKNYYGSVSYWWVIAQANEVGKGSLNLPAGIQLRIPTGISRIVANFESLNQ